MAALVSRSHSHPKREGSGDKPICTLFKYHWMLGVKLFKSYIESPPLIVSKWLMADCCALSKCDVSKGTEKSNKLKLYGDSKEATRKGWNCFLIKNYCGLDLAMPQV